MRQVISAAPSLDVSTLAARLATGAALVHDPSRALCQRYGYQTLYEVPKDLQKRLRRELIRGHAEQLRERPDGVFDHSVFLFLADWMRWLWGETPTEEWESVLVDAIPAVDRSEKIHHVVAAPRAGYDGYRWLDARNAKQVDKIMRGLYREFGCESRVVDVSLEP
jgi:hypothetical protein